MIPDRAACRAELEREQVPEHICRHSEQVARVTLSLARALNGGGHCLDMALLEAGALLHDIRKFHTVTEGGNHAKLGARWALEHGYGEVAPLIERHVALGLWDPRGPVTEAELVNYADKRVRHTELVSLDERFEDLLQRYGTSEKARKRIGEHWATVRELEAKIFKQLEFGPEAIG